MFTRIEKIAVYGNYAIRLFLDPTTAAQLMYKTAMVSTILYDEWCCGLLNCNVWPIYLNSSFKDSTGVTSLLVLISLPSIYLLFQAVVYPLSTYYSKL